MKITYTPNPLNTIIELDELDEERLKGKILRETLQDRLFHAYYSLQQQNIDWYNRVVAEDGAKKPLKTLDGVIQELFEHDLNPEYYLGNEDNTPTKLDLRVKELFDHYVEELKLGHIGDCTCVPCSCSKCHAEAYLGVNTIPGLSKHMGNYLDRLFRKHGEENINGVLDELKNYEPEVTPGFEAHVPRWKKQADETYIWLLRYKEEHNL